jgi:hypothetical protein
VLSVQDLKIHFDSLPLSPHCSRLSFDHLIRSEKDLLGNREANLLCGFEVDHESAMMTPQLSSLRTSFLALFITVMEIKKSVIYDGKHRRFVKRRGPILLEIELNDASGKSRRIALMENSVQSWCYLITLSARASTFGGIVKPICLADFRLTINSNFVGCSTGMSAGMLPFRILSTMDATRL